jgi:hypothetical protein
MSLSHDELMKKNVPAVKSSHHIVQGTYENTFFPGTGQRYCTEKPPAVLHRKAA